MSDRAQIITLLIGAILLALILAWRIWNFPAVGFSPSWGG